MEKCLRLIDGAAETKTISKSDQSLSLCLMTLNF
jgi:hypothetical protein